MPFVTEIMPNLRQRDHDVVLLTYDSEGVSQRIGHVIIPNGLTEEFMRHFEHTE